MFWHGEKSYPWLRQLYEKICLWNWTSSQSWSNSIWKHHLVSIWCYSDFKIYFIKCLSMTSCSTQTTNLWGSFQSHFTELWIEQTVWKRMVCPSQWLVISQCLVTWCPQWKTFINMTTWGLSPNITAWRNEQTIHNSWCIDSLSWKPTVKTMHLKKSGLSI